MHAVRGSDGANAGSGWVRSIRSTVRCMGTSGFPAQDRTGYPKWCMPRAPGGGATGPSGARGVGLDRDISGLRADPVEPAVDSGPDRKAERGRALGIGEQRDVGDSVALAGEPGVPAEVAL